MAGGAMEEQEDKQKMETMNISLPRELAEFIEKRVVGQFGNRSEYVRHLVREDEEKQKRIRFEQLIREGLEDEATAKEMTPADWEAIKRSVKERLRSRRSA
ncbi:MAG: hypothetical protein JNK16_03930 [Phycisphaerales bacterium]|nr:hypothetical protein [Phycisphaerales bacterium]